ncbi:MBL fold metallo-hydrolase [Paenibacillus sp. GYB003]|uniref:MBL fold metallo-hydrolase n=1 Tax=Paenibacillus sp. GYB003 TaxID=2994392 RepID=UPI002F9659E2
MDITFLGTAAAEGIPFPFCDCPTCRHAREHRGRNVRRRQSILIGGDLLVDAGPDLYASCADLGLSLTELRYALITHSHPDHFQTVNFAFRQKGFRLQTDLRPLTVVASPLVFAKWGGAGVSDDSAALARVSCLPNDRLSLPPYRVHAIEATHIAEAMNYVIDDGRHKLLYASDTGLYREHVWETVKDHRFDAVIMECTLGNRTRGPTHMSVGDMKTMLARMRELGCIDDSTPVYATHFSHQQVEPHESLSRMLLEEAGVHCAYDGLVVTL